MILAASLGESWTDRFFFFLNNKECTNETHDFLVWTRQNIIIQGSLRLITIPRLTELLEIKLLLVTACV
jgi:hypothetical protein